MQVVTEIQGRPINVLVDSGSTYNFLSHVAARRLNVSIDRHMGLQVAVANGEKISSTDMCRESLQVAGAIFLLTYIIPLDGIDFVLGVQWLMTLGP